MSRIRPSTRRRVASSPASHSGKQAVSSASAPARRASSSARAPSRRARSARRLVGPAAAWSSIRASCSSRISSKRSAGGFAWPAVPRAMPSSSRRYSTRLTGIAERAVGGVHRRRRLEADAPAPPGSAGGSSPGGAAGSARGSAARGRPGRGRAGARARARSSDRSPPGMAGADRTQGRRSPPGAAAPQPQHFDPFRSFVTRTTTLAPKHRPGLGGGPVSSPAPPRPRRDAARPPPCRPQAVNDVPQPQLDFALGLTKVKPPVSPWVT